MRVIHEIDRGVGKPRNLSKYTEALKVLPGQRMLESMSKMWVVNFWTFHEVSGGWKKVMEPTLKPVVTGAFGIFQISSFLAFPLCCSHPPFLDMESPQHVNLSGHDERWSRKGKSQDYASASAQSRTEWRTSKAAAQIGSSGISCHLNIKFVWAPSTVLHNGSVLRD